MSIFKGIEEYRVGKFVSGPPSSLKSPLFSVTVSSAIAAYDLVQFVVSLIVKSI